MCIGTKLLIKGFEPALRFKNERLRRGVGHAAKLLHRAAERQASNVLFLPSEIVPVIGRKIPQRADCNELKGAAQWTGPSDNSHAASRTCSLGNNRRRPASRRRVHHARRQSL